MTSKLQIDFTNAPPLVVEASHRVPTLSIHNTVEWKTAASIKRSDVVCHEQAALGHAKVAGTREFGASLPSEDIRAALDFALDELNAVEALVFLDDWRDGDLRDWPAFAEFVEKRNGKGG